MLNIVKFSTKRQNLYLSVAQGHFATGNSHSNYYIDVVSQKTCLSEARAVAKELCSDYCYYNTPIDTVVCLDGTEVIGACLADMISYSDYANINSQRSIYVVTPEATHGTQLLFRDNIIPMISGKNILILAVSVASGKTVRAAIEAIRYYGGKPIGAAAIFASNSECMGLPVRSVFDPNDLPGYICCRAHECPMCKEGKPIDALINSHGYSELK